MLTLRHFALSLLVLALGTAAPAVAQSPEDQARHHFRLGQAHYESGAFLEAAREFEESYRLSGRAALLHNVYVAYRDAADLARSAEALRRYLAEVPDAENATLLRQRLVALDRLIAERGASASPADLEPEEAEPEEPAEETEADATVAVEASSSVDMGSPPAEAGGGGGGLSPVGFVVGGVGAAALLVGAITGGLALGSEGALVEQCGAEGSCPEGYDFEAEVANGRALAITADVMIPVGVAALAAGVVLILVLRDGGGGDSVAAGAACGPDGCVGSLAGAF